GVEIGHVAGREAQPDVRPGAIFEGEDHDVLVLAGGRPGRTARVGRSARGLRGGRGRSGLGRGVAGRVVCGHRVGVGGRGREPGVRVGDQVGGRDVGAVTVDVVPGDAHGVGGGGPGEVDLRGGDRGGGETGRHRGRGDVRGGGGGGRSRSRGVGD